MMLKAAMSKKSMTLYRVHRSVVQVTPDIPIHLRKMCVMISENTVKMCVDHVVVSGEEK